MVDASYYWRRAFSYLLSRRGVSPAQSMMMESGGLVGTCALLIRVRAEVIAVYESSPKRGIVVTLHSHRRQKAK